MMMVMYADVDCVVHFLNYSANKKNRMIKSKFHPDKFVPEMFLRPYEVYFLCPDLAYSLYRQHGNPDPAIVGAGQ
jgi:hypothetical protein